MNKQELRIGNFVTQQGSNFVEEVTIELTLRYDSVEYQNCCGAFNLASCCTPCGG